MPFHDETGTFSQGRFVSALSQAGLSEGDYLAQLDKSIISQQISDSISLGAKFPNSISEELAKYELERRIAKIISFDIKPDEQPIPDVNEIRDWFKKNIENYDAPALRDIKLLLISPEELKSKVELSLDEMKEAFEQRSDEFKTPEKRVVRQMVFETAEQALAARNTVDSGTELEKSIETFSG